MGLPKAARASLMSLPVLIIYDLIYALGAIWVGEKCKLFQI